MSAERIPARLLGSLYDDAASLGLEIDNHESDLYLKDSPIARLLLKRFAHDSASLFKSNVDGQMWWDVPFAFLPWWRKRGCNVSGG